MKRLSIPAPLRRYLPILEWGHDYSRDTLSNDLVAAVIVMIMLIPQSLAYALLAGLPPEMGLYASILPLMAYALFGTSRTLAVGPVAVVSLMTAAVVGNMALQGTAEYAAAAIVLAFMSGLILLVTGLFRLGFLANFLSHPVISGFMTAAILLIGTSQLKHLFVVEKSKVRCFVDPVGEGFEVADGLVPAPAPGFTQALGPGIEDIGGDGGGRFAKPLNERRGSGSGKVVGGLVDL